MIPDTFLPNRKQLIIKLKILFANNQIFIDPRRLMVRVPHLDTRCHTQIRKCAKGTHLATNVLVTCQLNVFKNDIF